MSKMADTLVAARQRRGERLDEVEQATRIRQSYLRALESDDFARLPAPVYTRGFVRNYATYLELNAQELVRLYDEAIGYRPEPVRLTPAQAAPGGRLLTPNVAAIGVALALAAILFVWLYSALFVVGPASSARLPTPVVPTPTPIVALAVLTPTPTPEPPPPTPTAAPARVEPTATPEPAAMAVASLPSPTVGPTNTPSPTPRPEGLAPKVKVIEQPSWVQVRTDGVVVFSGTLAAGAERTFTATKEIFIHAGRSNAVDLTLNGVPQGRLGTPGQSVVRRTFTRDGAGAPAPTAPAAGVSGRLPAPSGAGR